MEKNQTVELLREVSKSADMGKNLVAEVLQMTEEPLMRLHLTEQVNTYDDLSRRANAMISVEGEVPEATNPIQKGMAQIGVRLQTLGNTSNKKIAEMLIDGANMGVRKMSESLSSYPEAGDGAVALANRLSEANTSCISEMTGYCAVNNL